MMMPKRLNHPRKKTHYEKLQILQEFQNSQQSLRAFIQAIPVPLSITSLADGRFLAVNRKFADLLEYDREELIGVSTEKIHLWSSRSALAELVDLLRKQNWVKNLETNLNSRTGREVHTLLSAERFWFMGQESMLISLVDITERKMIEMSLRARSDLLNSAGEMSSTLAEALELPQIYERLSNTIRQMLPEVTGVSISLFDAGQQSLGLVYGERAHAVHPAQLAPPPYRVPLQTSRSAIPLTGAELNQPPRICTTIDMQTQQPCLAVSMVAKGEVIGVVQVLSHPSYNFSDADAALISWIANTAAAAIQNSRLFETLKKTHNDLNHAYEATLDGWSRALELRDHDTQGHTDRVVEMTIELARRMGITGQEMENLRRGAQLHDIGKMGIPDYILLKPGPLTEEEWSIMRKHPLYAYEMLSPIPQFRDILDIPYCHHERWDGSGYPRRLRATEIPLAARVFSVVDVWDALSSNRPYREAWPRVQVLEYIRYESGKHFDPEIADMFLKMIS